MCVWNKGSQYQDFCRQNGKVAMPESNPVIRVKDNLASEDFLVGRVRKARANVLDQKRRLHLFVGAWLLLPVVGVAPLF